jgi:hypothetical protein
MTTHRPLTDCVVGFSISESEDMERLGFDRSEMNRCVVRLSESLLAAGARLAFGHDWRPGGVMVAVAALAVRYFHLGPDAAGESKAKAPIINRVAWPDLPFLAPAETSNPDASPPAGSAVDPMVRLLKGIVDARQTSVPEGTSRADALSLMRAELADLCNIRVCLGGKLTGSSGKMSGIVEEALGALRKGRPVFTSGIFGGASDLVARAMDSETDIENKSLTDDLRARLLAIRKLSASADKGLTAAEEKFLDDLGVALLEIRALSANVDRGLTAEEEKLLWHCTSTEQCVELILRGAVKCFTKNQETSH